MKEAGGAVNYRGGCADETGGRGLECGWAKLAEAGGVKHARARLGMKVVVATLRWGEPDGGKVK